MLGLRVKKHNAEKARRYLERHAQLSINHKLIGSNSFIYLPINEGTDRKSLEKARKEFGAKVLEKKFEPLKSQGKYREMLQENLGSRYEQATKSYDLIGNMALIDAKGTVAKEIAKAIMSTNKNVETVISKGSAVTGKYRVRKYVHILGKRNFIATYRENGATLTFDIRRTFFSSRLAFDRLRIARQVKKGENVMVMFAGMGPFVVEIAKMQKSAHVVGIELNRSACKYMRQNIAINKATNATAQVGDVKKLANKYRGFADRIVMPLPKDAYQFLDSVLVVAKKKCIVHYYGFGNKESAFEEHIEKIGKFLSSKGVKFKVLDKRVARVYSPKEIEVVLDILISR